MPPTYEIVISGCDDSTRFTVDLTTEAVQVVERIADLSREASEYGCMPTLSLRAVPDA